MSNTLQLFANLKKIKSLYLKKHHNANEKEICIDVVPSDGLPRQLDKNGNFFLYIINNQTRYEPGQHWISIFLKRNKNRKINATYFDAYAHPISVQNKKIRDFLKKNSQHVTYNNKCIQSVWSINCGLFCAVFLFHKINGSSLQTFLKNFSTKQLQRNDNIIEKMYKEIFHKTKKMKAKTVAKAKAKTIKKNQSGGHQFKQCFQTCCSFNEREKKRTKKHC